MKLFFIGSSGCVIWYIREHKIVSQTYDAAQDTFRVMFLAVSYTHLTLPTILRV